MDLLHLHRFSYQFLLMAASSIASMAGWSGTANDILKFLGTPIIALAVGTIFGVIQLVGAQRESINSMI
ncbi:MAG: hypothetical protein ACLUJR_08780 [Mediterraneibacter gnavus]